MRVELDLSRYRKACYWDEACPAGHHEPAGTRSISITTDAPCARPCQVALELCLPKGPTTWYGMLGCSYNPTPTASHVEVVVAYSDKPVGQGRRFNSSIATPSDPSFVGLPDEFTDAVLHGARDAIELGIEVGPGVLSFDRAANGAVGSSRAMFRLIARTVTALVRIGVASEADLRRALLDLVP